MGRLEGFRCNYFVDVEAGHDDEEDEVEVLQDYEEVEVWVVLDSNAVVNPLTVMIKPLNTLITNIAVSAIGSAYDLTVWTQ